MERLRDTDGDVWERQADGRYELTDSHDTPSAVGLVCTMERLYVDFGPLEALVPAAAPDSANLADFVRELRELCDRWASKLGV